MDKTMKAFKREAFKRKVQEKATWCKDQAKRGVEYFSENPEKLIPVALAFAPVAKKAVGTYQVHAEKKDRLTRFYDPRTGDWTYTSRPLKAREIAELERRYTAGESKASILYSMGLAR